MIPKERSSLIRNYNLFNLVKLALFTDRFTASKSTIKMQDDIKTNILT